MYFNQRLLVSLLVLGFGTSLATGLRAEPGHVFEPVTPEQSASIEAGLPPETFAPAQARRVLVFFRTEGFVHKSIPVGILTLQRLGEKTKAFTTFASEDMAMFTSENLARFDAVVFLNSTGLKFTDPVHRQALLDFVRGGKGVIGVHAASDNFPTWPEGQALIGGVFHGHPWTAKEVSAVKLDEPKHVLNLPFGGTGFWVREEIYQHKEPYSRERQRVLLSLDMSKPQNARPADKIKRTDNDFAISWIKTEGKGRVFYTSLGHNEDIFYVQPILRHLLDGMRFALGDLKVDTAPSAQAGVITPALAPDDATPIQKVWSDRLVKSKTASSTAAKASDDAAGKPIGKPIITEAEQIAVLMDPAASQPSVFAALANLTLNGTAASVPAIAATAVLDKPGLAERSAEVLAQLRLPEAESALLKITEKLAAGTLSPFIAALCHYRTPATFKRLSTLATGTNAADARAARSALASFGSGGSVDFLLKLPAGPDTTPFVLAAADAWLGRDAKAAPSVAATAEKILDSASAPSDRVEAVTLLARSLPPEKISRLIKRVGDPEPRVRQAAAAAVARSRNAASIAELAAIWATLSIDTQIAALSAVSDTSGLPLIRLSLGSTDENVAAVCIARISRINETDTLVSLISNLGKPGPLYNATYSALTGAQAKDLSARLAAVASKPEAAPELRHALISLLAERQAPEVYPLVIELCASTDDKLRAVAFQALGTLEQPGPLDTVIKLSAKAKKSADQRGFRKALQKAVILEPNKAQAVELLGKVIADPAGTERATFIGALTLAGGTEADTLLTSLLTNPVSADRKEVIRALSAARSEGSLKLLQQTAERSTDASERILAVRGCIETIPTLESLNRSNKIKQFRQLWKLASRAEETGAILDAVREIGGNEAKSFVNEFAPASAPDTAKPDKV